MAQQSVAPALQKVLDSVDKLFSLPEITQKIIAAAQDANSNVYQLLKLISHDPALVARIMKVVNSAYHGLSNPVTSLDRAITMLGLRSIENLAVASGIGGLFKGESLGRNFSPRDLWSHSIAVAVVARELARQAKLPNADEAFLIGMLHDLGIIILYQEVPRTLRSICDAAAMGQKSVLELEQELLGFDHQQLGAALGEKWKFPPAICAGLRFHHQPTEAPEAYKSLAALVYVADTLCCQLNEGFYLTALYQPLSPNVLQLIPLDEAIVQNVRNNFFNLIQLASPFQDF